MWTLLSSLSKLNAALGDWAFNCYNSVCITEKKIFKISYGFNLLVPKPYGPVTFSTHMNKTF